MQYEIQEHPDTGDPIVVGEHGEFGLGCKPKNVSAYADRYPPLGAKFPDIEKGYWNDQDFRPYCRPVMNQGRSSACLPHAVVEVMAVMSAMTEDEKWLLSAWYLYGHINGGKDQGSSLPDALQAAETAGVCLDSSVKQGAMFGPYPAAATAEAKRFRIETAYDGPTHANVCSAVERNFPCVIGIDIGANFTPDANGFLPPFQAAPEGVLGHGLAVVGKKYANGIWWPLIQNHWTAQWGMAGFAYLHPSYINPYFGAWVPRILKMDPNDPTPAPAAE